MGDLSKHFNRSEFECRCGCGMDDISMELVEALEDVREHFGPVVITSGCRCPSHNARVGGSSNSYHVRSLTADFTVRGVGVDTVQDYLQSKYPDRYGIGCYPAWTHLDVRETGGRW